MHGKQIPKKNFKNNNNSRNIGPTEDLMGKLKNHLRQDLNQCNSTVDSLQSRDIDLQLSKKFAIPNNNRKSAVTGNKNDTCKLMYFFPDSSLNTDLNSDFCIEMEANHNFQASRILFEGYLYTKEASHVNKYHYLVTDLLSLDGKSILDSKMLLRRQILQGLFDQDRLHNEDINGHLNIYASPIFEAYDGRLNPLTYDLFKANFPFADQLIAIEYTLDSFFGKRVLESQSNPIPVNCEKVVKKTKYFDVFSVYDPNTGVDEGILYVKTLQDSQKLRKNFETTDSIVINCEWNSQFLKWKPIF
jgi:hypothetical protein